MAASTWSDDEQRFMRQAMALARRPDDRVSPNPRVGALVVRGGRVVGRGFHCGPGTEHGEAMALRRAGARARGGTLYLNLEPCAHWGRTPPCTDAILASGISRVVYAIGDPDPRVSGRGARILAKAGLRVERGLLEEEARELNRAYLHWKETGRPWVTLKLAMTLDGRTADASGRSRWITGPVSRRVVHAMRREADLVMVGRRTVEADDPALDVRIPATGGRRGSRESRTSGGAPPRNPLRMVVDSRLRADPALRFFRCEDAERTLVATTRGAPARRVRELEARGIRVVRVAANGDGQVALRPLLRRLGALGVTRALVEGGAELAGSFLDAGLADDVALFHAPIYLGERGIDRPIRFDETAWGRVGDDALFVARTRRSGRR